MTINQEQCIRYGVTTSEAALMDLLNQLSSWADERIIGGQTYYFLSRTKVMDELPYFFKKKDTVYRAFKSLETKKMVEYRTEKKRDFLRLTSYGKKWNTTDKNSEINPSSVPKNSEKNPNPEKNPRKLGNKSELQAEDKQLLISTVNTKNSEKNPTDKYYKYTKDNSERALLEKIDADSPLVFDSILNNTPFHQRLASHLTSKGIRYDFDGDVLPVLVKWLCQNWTASGLSSSTSNMRSLATSYVLKVMENGGLSPIVTKGGIGNDVTVSQIIGKRL